MTNIQCYRNGYEIRPSLEIFATMSQVWDQMIDVKDWWVASNDEHCYLEITSAEKSLRTGTAIKLKEKIAGIPCVAFGNITYMKPKENITWKAEYLLFGLRWIRVHAGVSWQLAEINNKTRLTAVVWSHFPQTLPHRFLYFLFKLMDGINKDYEHALKELKFLKKKIEDKIK